jgi:hypothetical protein
MSRVSNGCPTAEVWRGPKMDSACSDVVGDTGFEPVTSSVSRKRSPPELIALRAE